jgi:hypothetical protein
MCLPVFLGAIIFHTFAHAHATACRSELNTSSWMGCVYDVTVAV